MLGFSSFTRKPRQFSYKPLFYDEEQEARDVRRRAAMLEEEGAEKAYVPGTYINSERQRRRHPAEKKGGAKMRVALIRFVIAVALLLAFAWVIISF